jgi:ParB family chromosome partitioning protein
MEGRRRALGRGLGALIPSAPPAREARDGDSVATAPVAAIRPNPYQPRESFGKEGIDELAASIRQKGLLQPLLVRRAGAGYELIAGERRFRAAQRAGLEAVPVAIREADDRESLELALIENLQRENLNPMEEARAYKRLGDDFGLKQEEIARRVGKNRSTVANSLRLLQLPGEVQRQIEQGALSAGHARSILALASVAEQKRTAQNIVRKKLSVRDAERLARERSKPAGGLDQKALESRLARGLGTRVRLRHNIRSGAGRLEIEYYSLAELNGLVDRLTESNDPVASF